MTGRGDGVFVYIYGIGFGFFFVVFKLVPVFKFAIVIDSYEAVQFLVIYNSVYISLVGIVRAACFDSSGFFFFFSLVDIIMNTILVEVFGRNILFRVVV